MNLDLLDIPIYHCARGMKKEEAARIAEEAKNRITLSRVWPIHLLMEMDSRLVAQASGNIAIERNFEDVQASSRA